MFWKKRYYKMESLKLDISDLERRLEESEKRQEKLERILKYAGEEPSVRIDCYACVMYLYVDKEEYEIDISNVLFSYFPDEAVTIRIKNEVAYVDFIVKFMDDLIMTYHFIVDYKHGTYICTKEEENAHEP